MGMGFPPHLIVECEHIVVKCQCDCAGHQTLVKYSVPNAVDRITTGHTFAIVLTTKEPLAF